MQTQCPHCNTRFRVTKTQVDIAEGMVRCGVCKEIFNTIDVASEHELQASLLKEETLNKETLTEPEYSNVSTNAETTDSTHNKNDDYTEVQTLSTDAESSDDDETPDSTTKDFDFFSDNDSFSENVVPDNFREAHTGDSHSVISTLLWSIGVLVLTGTLVLEYIWFNRDQFSQVPELQAGLDTLCTYVECKDVSIRVPSEIALITRNVYSHPNEKNALVINVTMKNNAGFAQPYPVMQIDFSNIRGETVAARRFMPSDYLQMESGHLPLLQPNKVTSLNLEIKDPGKDAMTYEFNFL